METRDILEEIIEIYKPMKKVIDELIRTEEYFRSKGFDFNLGNYASEIEGAYDNITLESKQAIGQFLDVPRLNLIKSLDNVIRTKVHHNSYKGDIIRARFDFLRMLAVTIEECLPNLTFEIPETNEKIEIDITNTKLIQEIADEVKKFMSENMQNEEIDNLKSEYSKLKILIDKINERLDLEEIKGVRKELKEIIIALFPFIRKGDAVLKLISYTGKLLLTKGNI